MKLEIEVTDNKDYKEIVEGMSFKKIIKSVQNKVNKGTKVNIIDQPVKAGWKNGELYIEVHKLPKYVRENSVKSSNNDKNLLPIAYESVQKAAGVDILKVNWNEVKLAVKEATGIPHKISK